MNIHNNITQNSQRQKPKCPPVNEWVNRMWSSHTMEFFSCKKEWTTDTCYMMNLENIRLGERSQQRKAIYFILPFI